MLSQSDMVVCESEKGRGARDRTQEVSLDMYPTLAGQESARWGLSGHVLDGMKQGWRGATGTASRAVGGGNGAKGNQWLETQQV